ncbi:cache domain-containing sensor histidine kinase [Paenibacillus thalictri]|uniref:histidine kinase n=1 Tax=Paenibacillus thalictri TaxID=2527873 RepID=A0A4Q9DN81_9BACL|nr:sensor histidine kinase [Paenibacillus thalictri]TBL75237.1 sensor histidine kinase [Paenibacillus thalictri]
MKRIASGTLLKNFAWLVAFIMVPVLLLSYGYVAYWGNYIQQQEIEKDTKFLSQTGITLDTILNDITQAISLLEFDQNLSDAIEEMVDTEGNISPSKFIYLNSVWDNTFRTLIAKPYVRSAYFYHEQNKRFIFTTDGIRNLADFPDMSWLASYNQASEDKNYWAEVRSIPTNDSSGAQFEALSLFRKVPIFSTKGKGVFIINLETKYFDSLLANLPNIGEKNVFILDGASQVLYSNNGSRLANYLTDNDIKSFTNTGHLVKRLDTLDYLVSYTKSKHYDWTYISIIPVQSLLTQLQWMKKLTAAFVAGTCVLITVLAFVYSKRNFRPVQTMVELIKHHEAGKDILHYKPGKNDEYAFVTYHIVRNFIEKNEMRQTLAEQKLLQKETELYALQSQINPHFLYNVLETINWEAIDRLGRKNTISELLLQLSGNLRYITRDHNGLVTFEEDVQHLKMYLHMQQLIHQQRFAIVYDIDESALICHTIKLLIQPIVENSIMHGLADLAAHDPKPTVKITLRRADSHLLVKVADNGCGIGHSQLAALRERIQAAHPPQLDGRTASGLGLQNVNQRIKLKFGGEFGLTVNSRPNKGTVVALTVPVIHSKL